MKNSNRTMHDNRSQQLFELILFAADKTFAARQLLRVKAAPVIPAAPYYITIAIDKLSAAVLYPVIFTSKYCRYG